MSWARLALLIQLGGLRRGLTWARLAAQSFHALGRLQDPASYVELDPDMASTLLDQKDSGKTLLLITNSDYECVAWGQGPTGA